MNEKLIHISDMSLSDRDIIQEKDNSIQNRSFYSTDLDVPDLVAKKDYFQLKIIKDENMMELRSISIKKIISLISGESHERLEENYLDYITWLIGTGDDFEKQQLLIPNEKVDNIEVNLEPSYYQLLTKTKIYYINIPKINKSNQINKRIKLKSNSLGKISSFLGLDIFDISDFIEIFILSFKEKEDLENKKSIKSKLIERFNYEMPKGIEDFNITKKLDLVLKESEKCQKNQLQNYEDIFEKVWNEIEKKNKNDESNNISEEEQSSQNNNDEDNQEKNYEVPNIYNINQNINKRIDKDKNLVLREENGCGENICENICQIF